MKRLRWACTCGLTFLGTGLGLWPVWAWAAGPFWFREAASHGAETRLVNDLPVLIVQGSPEQIGRQTAALTADAMKQLIEFPWALVTLMGRQGEWSKHVATVRALLERFPPDHRRELEACAAATGLDRDKLVGMNTMLDVYGGFGCSSLIAEEDHSATGSPLFGRNLDFFGLGILQRYNLVVICRPTGKHAFVTVGFPGVFGAISGMNDQGLAVAVHGVFAAADGGRAFDPQGTPCLMLYRRVLEECSTVEQAEQLLRASRHTTALSVVLCDRSKAGVAEVAPGSVAFRRSEDGLCACTNHFRAGRTFGAEFCPRYIALRRSAGMGKLGLAEMARKLHEVNQGYQTLQTMIFEPGPLELHLAIGSCPSSALPLKRLGLASFFNQHAPAAGHAPTH